jgi:hypothetical protein
MEGDFEALKAAWPPRHDALGPVDESAGGLFRVKVCRRMRNAIRPDSPHTGAVPDTELIENVRIPDLDRSSQVIALYHDLEYWTF